MPGYAKPKCQCPYCVEAGAKMANGEYRPFGTAGMLAHVRSQHADKLVDWKENKATYVADYKCDDDGKLLKGGSPSGDTFQEDPEPDGDDEEYKIEEIDEEPDPEPKPEPKPKPKPKPEPDDGWHPLIRL